MTTSAHPTRSTLLELTHELQGQYLATTTPENRKEKGQFFTPSPVASFMASLLPFRDGMIRVLDPGAGAGALTSAFCEQVLRQPSPRQIHFDMFETDVEVLPQLEKTATACRKSLAFAGHEMTYRVIPEDFVLTMAPERGTLFNDTRERYDTVITNPPYFKINKASAYAQAMPEVVHGQPNIYALFLAVAASLLKPGGNLVAITPRSFCNGLYFREFRRWFLDRMSLDRVHLFRSRKDTFREASVLQESVITLSTRTDTPATTTVVSRSDDRELKALHEQKLPTEWVVNRQDWDRVIYIPETNEDAEIVRFAQQWKQPFEGHQLRISTGPVVMFRAKEFLLDVEDKGVPLLSAHNVKRFSTHWPVAKAKWPLSFVDTEASRKHLLPIRNYVLLKRFSAKEERRRLTAGCLLRGDFPFDRVAIENHLNYIYHADRELSIDETRGVAAIFNSVFFDRYFRTLSGNTQVNATEVRTLRFPNLEIIARIGYSIGRLDSTLPLNAEQIVLEEFGINGSLRRYLEARFA